ncbi:TetR/AcrR family transcriptional regulator [uncultured Neglectibacter sp.]|uniref:TetR/AcrR family transcriptional regulator n=1 Tax=uncultured Neglectibacter sp. TaxID=1924108 RepID=UPI0034DFABCD
MPPKTKISRDMIISAAFALTREQGIDAVNARTVSERLGCSTQPVMYHFRRIEELKRAVYEETDRFHSKYLLEQRDSTIDILSSIGLNYIRFAVEEPHLFRLLFQSGYAVENSVVEMINSKELQEVLAVMQEAMDLDADQTRQVFLTLSLFVHGYASLIANNGLQYDEALISAQLEQVYRGAVLAVQ